MSIKRNPNNGDAIVDYDENGKLRYVYSDGSLDMGSSVEERAPHELRVKENIARVVEMLVPNNEFPELVTSEQREATEAFLRGKVLPIVLE